MMKLFRLGRCYQSINCSLCSTYGQTPAYLLTFGAHGHITTALAQQPFPVQTHRVGKFRIHTDWPCGRQALCEMPKVPEWNAILFKADTALMRSASYGSRITYVLHVQG